MLLTFEPARDGHGVDIVDRIERRRCRLITDRPVEPEPIPTDEFEFPVDRGFRITAGRVLLSHTSAVHVRNQSGLVIDELTEGDSRSYPADRYSLDVSAPIKLFFVVYDPLSIEVTADEVILRFDEPTDIIVGARSYHKQPAAAVTTSNEPEDMLRAVSTFGSALKTTTCERSFPTLRGHPPTVELGESLEIPSVLETADTGVTVEIPAEYRSIFVTAPLAYYLGATLRSGDRPKLLTRDGFKHPLDDSKRGFEGEVERVLKQVFFLDCLTRTEGYYPVNLHERNALDGSLNLDFESLYSQPLREQIETYLEVPYHTIEPHLPMWKLTAHVEISPENIELLPFVVNDLAVIRTPDESTMMGSAGQTESKARGITDGGVSRGALLRSDAETETISGLVQFEEGDSLEQTWIGDLTPLGASKAMIAAFRNGMNRTPTSGDIDITVVCNDVEMDDERDVVDQVYGSRDELPFDVSIHRELTVGDLADVLAEERDFLHYIGHIDRQGFECTDGWFDASELDETGVDSFFLNACTSYQQGRHLIEAGSVAGVVTLDDVINSGAERVGKTLARLLNLGFPLASALNIAKQKSIIGGHYLVIGDGGFDFIQPEGSIPGMCEIECCNGDLFNVEYRTFTTSYRGLGTVSYPIISGNNEYFLASGNTGDFNLSREELVNFLNSEEMPVRYKNLWTWSSTLDI